MSLQIRLSDFVTAVATDIKGIRTNVSGDATGGLTGLTTTAKTSIVSAINEVNGKVPPAPSAATETAFGIVELATQVETNTGTADDRVITPLKFQTRLAAYAQPLAANLTTLAGVASTTYGRGFLTLVDQAGLMGLLSVATETVAGISRNATQLETNAGTLDTVAVTPLKFQTRLAAYAQPLAANLTSLAGQASTAYGRGLLAVVDQAGLTGLIASASATVVGVSRNGTQAEVDAGTNNAVGLTPLTFQTRLAAYAQAKSTNLTALDIASTAYGRGFLSLVDQAGLTGLVRTASEAVTGIARFATQAETNAGTLDTVVVTPLKFQTRLAAFAQPLAANLTTLAGITPGATGQSLLAATTAAGAKTTLGLATVATSGLASDLTGTLPTSALPPLAINETFVVTTQVAMLALTAQRGDMAIRTDLNRTFVLSTDDPTLVGNWIQVTAGGDVTSVAGRIGAVTLAKADVGLANVDNTSDASKPVSTAQQTAIDLRLLKTANLSDLANVATARTNLSVYSQAEIGNPETDLVAAYATAKA